MVADGIIWCFSIFEGSLGSTFLMFFFKDSYSTYKRHKKLINEGSHSEIGVLTNFRKWKSAGDGTRRTVYDGDGEGCSEPHFCCDVYYVGSKSRDNQKYMRKCWEYQLLRERFERLKDEADEKGGYIEGVDIVYDPNDMKEFITNDELEDARNSC